MSVIICQGEATIVAMNGVVIGISDEENMQIMENQKRIFKNDSQISSLLEGDDFYDEMVDDNWPI